MERTLPRFRIAFTGDFLDEGGQSAYGDVGLSLLQKNSIEWSFLLDQSPPKSDPGYWERFYTLEVKPEHIIGMNGLVVLRPAVKRSTFAGGAADLVVIGRSGAGYDKIDLEACTENDVALFNAPMALHHSTASAALLLMLALAKKLRQHQDITRQGRWDLQPKIMGSEIRGRTLGIIGLGHSGRELARLVAPFSMTVLSYSPHADPAQARELGVRLTALEETLREADFISFHCRLTAETRHMVGAEQLAWMKPTAYLVNVARGALVDQEALVQTLRVRRIAGAALDVFEVEPLPRHDPLHQLDNVILTPHWLASTDDVWRATGQAMAEGMIRVSRGEIPAHVVNQEVLMRPGFRAKLERFKKAGSG
jgi:phosphoglycerate dehydrogenase-like enzyme